MKFLVRKAPENFIRTVNDEISSLLNRHFDSYFPEAAYWEDMDKYSMPVEISDKGRDYEVKAELPGVKKEDLEIGIKENILSISAKRKKIIKSENGDEKEEVISSYYQSFNISTKGIDVENIEANLTDGVLTVSLPKKEELKYERKIEIKGA